jgi:enoyl-CoA hydratase
MMVELTRSGQAAVITLNRPTALNALSFAILGELAAAIDRADQSDARFLVVTGAGEKAFCAGADIKELRNRGSAQQRSGARFGQSIFAKLDELRLPSIALINGFAFGGGLELALACTFRLAAPRAAMGLPEVKLGLIPGYGGTQRLPRLIGEGRALEMIMSGRTVPAQEALSIGLVHAIIEGDLMEGALRFGARFAGYSLAALGLARSAVAGALDHSLLDGLKLEAELSTMAYRTRDAEEGMAAFEEKRPAVFKDE